jgi:hypothetical protein
MEASNLPENGVAAGLASYGVEADEVELAVIAAARELFWPGILALLELDTSSVDPERDPDLSRAPRA